MRRGYVIWGVVLLIIGIVIITAVLYSVATCPSGYTCTANPIGTGISVFLIVWGALLLMIGIRARAPMRPLAAPGFYPQTYPPSPGYATAPGYGTPPGPPAPSQYSMPPAPPPAPPTFQVAPPAPPPAQPPPGPPAPNCVGCGAPTTFVAQYGRFYCPSCQRYV